jgi:predicted secreted protein
MQSGNENIVGYEMKGSMKPMRFVLALALLFCGWAASANAHSTDGDKTDDGKTKVEAANRPLAVVRKFKPDVYIKHKDSDEWVQAKMGAQLFNSDSLRTASAGFAAVQFMDNSIVKIKPNSILALNGEVRGKDDTSTRLAMEVGEVFLQITKQKSQFEVATPSAVAAVKGTEFGTNVGEDGSSDIYVFEGIVQVTPNNGKGNGKDLTAGMYGNVDSNGEGMNTGEMSDEERKKLRKSFDNEGETEIKTLKLKFIDEDGQVRTIDIKYEQQKDQQ